MDCRTAIERMLGDAPVAGEAALADHVAGCARCRQMQELIARLREGGMAAQERDLSLRTIRATRRRAAEALAGQTVAGTALWTPLAARLAAVCGLLLLAVGLLAYSGRALQRPDGDAPANLLELDARIARLQKRVARDLGRFRMWHADAGRPTSLETRADELRNRIAMCSLQIRNELDGAARGSAGRSEDDVL